MEYKDFAETGLKPSVLGMGCSKIAALGKDRSEIVAMLEEAIGNGVNFFDTADNYSYGDSERLLGKVIGRRRGEMILCTKAGHTRGRVSRVGKFAIPLAKKLVRSLKPLRKAATSAAGNMPGGRNYQPDYAVQSIEQSLRRFGTDYLDVFLIHGPSPEDLADGALLDALSRLKDKGVIRHYGVSCTRWASAEDVLKFLELSGPTVLQISVSPYNTEAFKAALAPAASRGVGLIARDILYKGQLLSDPNMQAALTKHAGRSAAQVAFQFAAQENPAGPVLAGLSSREHLRDLLSALSSPPLNPDDVEELRSLGEEFAPAKVNPAI